MVVARFLLVMAVCSSAMGRMTGTLDGEEAEEEDIGLASSNRTPGLVHCNSQQCCPSYTRCCWRSFSYKCCRGGANSLVVFPVVSCD